ncbi:MAG: AAA family ATPase [Pirellulales bacterium]
MKNPEKFQETRWSHSQGEDVAGAGPPGTGKTLLARPWSTGEAGDPILFGQWQRIHSNVRWRWSETGVRDLFQQAKGNTLTIIFIDEIDAVVVNAEVTLGGGHDEREQTLNQILSEMDGFAGANSVIVVVSTVRCFRPSLASSGHSNRHITVGRPTQKSRLEMFKVHTRDLPPWITILTGQTACRHDWVNWYRLVRNLVNEAALWAALEEQSNSVSGDF